MKTIQVVPLCDNVDEACAELEKLLCNLVDKGYVMLALNPACMLDTITLANAQTEATHKGIQGASRN